MKIDGSLARNIDFEVANLEVHKKICRKTSILKLQSVKIGGSLARVMFVLMLPRVSSRVSGFPVASPCLWGKAVKPLLLEGFQAGCRVVLRGRRGTL